MVGHVFTIWLDISMHTSSGNNECWHWKTLKYWITQSFRYCGKRLAQFTEIHSLQIVNIKYGSKTSVRFFLDMLVENCQLCASLDAKGKTEGSLKSWRVHLLGTMCTDPECHGSASKSCWETAVWTKVCVCVAGGKGGSNSLMYVWCQWNISNRIQSKDLIWKPKHVTFHSRPNESNREYESWVWWIETSVSMNVCFEAKRKLPLPNHLCCCWCSIKQGLLKC